MTLAKIPAGVTMTPAKLIRWRHFSWAEFDIFGSVLMGGGSRAVTGLLKIPPVARGRQRHRENSHRRRARAVTGPRKSLLLPASGDGSSIKSPPLRAGGDNTLRKSPPQRTGGDCTSKSHPRRAQVETGPRKSHPRPKHAETGPRKSHPATCEIYFEN